MLDWMNEHVPLTQAVSTILLLLLVVLARLIVQRQVIRSTKLSDELRRQWIVQMRNVLLIVLILGLLIIWGHELRTVALSAVAIAAALVVATKELIMCISGTLLEGSAHAFKIGDRIEVAGHRGDVFDQTLLTTTILEIGPGQLTHQYTGRTIVLPNSVFLNQPIINETATDEFVLHIFAVPVRADEDWRVLEERLLEAANAECASYLDEARRHMEQIGREQGTRGLSVEPRVTLRVPAPDRVDLMVRLPVPAARRGRIEQAILRRAVVPTMAEHARERALHVGK